jgi:hypothetical protein
MKGSVSLSVFAASPLLPIVLFATSLGCSGKERERVRDRETRSWVGREEELPSFIACVYMGVPKSHVTLIKELCTLLWASPSLYSLPSTADR